LLLHFNVAEFFLVNDHILKEFLILHPFMSKMPAAKLKAFLQVVKLKYDFITTASALDFMIFY